MKLVTILKLGGSAITNKSRLCTPNLRVIQQSADQIARYPNPLILLHGGGSYAHPVVTRARLDKGFRHSWQLRPIADTELLLDQLSRFVGVSLLRRERAFVALRPMSFLTMRNGKIETLFLRPIESALAMGLMPLIHGDLAFDSAKGISAVSADQIASYLGIRLGTSRVLLGCNVDGVFTEDPRGSPTARLIETIDQTNSASIIRKLRGSMRIDATESMLGKVKEAVKLAENGRESVIFNLTKPGFLEEALVGRLSTCSRFLPWK